MTIKGAAEGHLADSIVYLCALLADRPRFIDRYIDYYGETPRGTRDGEAGSHSRPSGSRQPNKGVDHDVVQDAHSLKP
jgi:hypothetical protein